MKGLLTAAAAGVPQSMVVRLVSTSAYECAGGVGETLAVMVKGCLRV